MEKMLPEKSGYILPISKLIKFWKTFQKFISGSVTWFNQKEDISSCGCS